MTRICIVGAGAIGGWLGTLLGQLGDVQLSVLARGATLAAVQKNGLQLQRNASDGTRRSGCGLRP